MNVGKIQGFPIGGRCIINDRCKMRPVRKFFKDMKDIIHYVGIAIDEPKRLERLRGTNKASLLEKYGYTEKMACELCKEYDLLSPLYQRVSRGVLVLPQCKDTRVVECKTLLSANVGTFTRNE